MRGRRARLPAPARERFARVVVAGSTGEAATLDDDEHIGLLRAIVDEVGDEATLVSVGRGPMTLGTRSN